MMSPRVHKPVSNMANHRGELRSFMEKMRLLPAILLASLVGQCLYSSVGAVEVFYVVPTEPATECPSGDSPCHSLQYYVDHSNFTNNTMFLFMKGEHYLDGVVHAMNVANLSLVGEGFGVKILCNSQTSRFVIEEFAGLNFEYLDISDLADFTLVTGTNVIINQVNITSLEHYANATLRAINVVELFSITNSTFLDIDSVQVHYDMTVKGFGHFMFRNNKLSTQLFLTIAISNLEVSIMDSIFERENDMNGLYIYFQTLRNNSILIGNNEFKKSGIHLTVCARCNLRCSQPYCIKFTGITSSSTAEFDFGFSKESVLLIENSIFSDFYCSSCRQLLNFQFGYDPSVFDDSVQVTLHNVTITNNVLENQLNGVTNLYAVAILIVNCRFENNIGSAVEAVSSKLVFEGNTVFFNNSAAVGGGIQLTNFAVSYIYLQQNASVEFMSNHADFMGGAIYGTNEQLCFLHKESASQLIFANNTANISGSSLYVNGLSNGLSFCLESIFNISNTESDPSAAASDPYRLCLCEDGKHQPNCSSDNKVFTTEAFPGQEFPIRLAVVGSILNGVVPGAIRAFVITPNDALENFHSSRATDKPYCETLNYSVNSTKKVVTLALAAERTFFSVITQRDCLVITVHLKDCPAGFSLSPATGSCVCDDLVFDTDMVQCDINNQSFLRFDSAWIGFVTTTTSNVSGVMFHPNCPIGYCLPQEVSITSNTSDRQCQPHRTGLLCGECEEGYSLTLRNGKCRKCFNTYLLLILPLAVAGLLLVAILFALNLTITEGSINGLIFYANILGMNHNVLISGETSHLYAFLAWLNLDLGISTCLYDGLDGYAETWLQFIFPVYLWVIGLGIIQLYRKFPRIANRFGGEQPVQVLATLLLLSYTKLQRTVVTILAFTTLKYPDGEVRYVWLYDANLEYFNGKHLYLGIVGILILVFLIAPYVLCLTFIQQLQACSDRRLFQWVNKLKPVFDCYTGPYKDNYRFWTGMLLVVRTLLIIFFTINILGSVETSLLIILIVAFVLAVANSNGIYKKWLYNYLESFFYLQLGVFAGCAAYVRRDHGSSRAVADTSIGVALLVFLAVVSYHAFRKIAALKQHYYQHRGYADIEGEDQSVNLDRI